MNKFINKLLENGLGNIIDKDMDKLVYEDKTYQQDSNDEKELEKRYDDLDLSKQERILINDYIACIQTTNARAVELAYIAGIRDIIKFLNGLGLLKGSTKDFKKCLKKL